MVAELTIDRKAPVRRQQLDATSWVDVVDGFFRNAGDQFAVLRDASPWQQTEVLRCERYVPERRLSTELRADAQPLLRQTELHLAATYGVRWTGVAAILYCDGEDFQGFHGDRELRWLDDVLIAIVVLGARRPFVLRPRRPGPQVRDGVPAGAGPDDVVLTPGHGDLLVMGGACQRDWLHTVPPAATDDERISLTWRWTSRRGRPDTNPTFYEGRHFSDRPRQPGAPADVRPDRPSSRAPDPAGVDRGRPTVIEVTESRAAASRAIGRITSRSAVRAGLDRYRNR